MNRISKVLLAMGASVAVGAALGVLYAPDDGCTTRRRLIKKGRKLVGTVNDKMDDGMESLEEMKDVLQKQLNKINRKLEEHKC